MGRSAAYLLIAALGFAAALALASCGKEDAQLLPGNTAREILANLDAVEQLASEGDCIGAESAAEQVSEQIEALTGIDAKLKEALRDGGTRLNEVVDECEEATTESIGPASVPTETEETLEEPPHGKGKGKGPDKEKPKEEKVPPPPPPKPPEPEVEEEGDEQEEEAPSGGVGPGSPAEEGD